MARVIVMDREAHEPLTIVEAPASFIRKLTDGGPRRLTFWIPESLEPFYATPPLERPSQATTHTTSIEFEPIMRSSEHGSVILFWIAYACAPATALLLRAAFLPGQIAENHRLRKEAYIRGAFDVMFGSEGDPWQN